MTTDFVPSNEGELIQWAANLQAKIGTYTATFGLLPTDITAISNACTRISTDILCRCWCCHQQPERAYHRRICPAFMLLVPLRLNTNNGYNKGPFTRG